ncbi:hypothetical protein JQC92_01015 [Shewanella sp. 202IG2-18]|uniref:hypothetical protein n=1 Tax=Parashewanella hymeniacidonis TaxID=2807618 RepID=UPI001960B5C7|nr:hypothetical protein [Parashewanella hymeniacidonis]MBM7070625.1 hypothetical protein [Parashewanella hymeniacidonis]
MEYKEYLNAARKHLTTCEVIKNSIEELDSKSADSGTSKQLLLNLYYLTGYVFECSIKYGIYKVINYERGKPVQQLDTAALSYKSHIKFHRFTKYQDHLISKSPGIKLIDDRSQVPRDIILLYKSWDAEVRYWYSACNSDVEGRLTKTNLFKLLDYAICAFKHISRL